MECFATQEVPAGNTKSLERGRMERVIKEEKITRQELEKEHSEYIPVYGAWEDRHEYNHGIIGDLKWFIKHVVNGEYQWSFHETMPHDTKD